MLAANASDHMFPPQDFKTRRSLKTSVFWHVYLSSMDFTKVTQSNKTEDTEWHQTVFDYVEMFS